MHVKSQFYYKMKRN